MNSFDEGTYETMGEALAYRVFWTRFGQGALLTLLTSHGTPSSDRQESRRLLCKALKENLRVLREEMQFPWPPDMPPDAAKIAGNSFHKTFRHLEDDFWMKACLIMPEVFE